MVFVKGYAQTEEHKRRIGEANKGNHLGATSSGAPVIRGEEKLCLMCGKWKPFSEYHRRPDRPIGLRAKCKSCEKDYRSKDVEGVKFTQYKSGAKRRGLPFDLTLDQFLSFWGEPCSYCGDPINTIGLDRMDTSLGYSIDNISPCCGACNAMKSTMSKDEFIERCARISNRAAVVPD